MRTVSFVTLRLCGHITALRRPLNRVREGRSTEPVLTGSEPSGDGWHNGWLAYKAAADEHEKEF
jgi:hypothetical protein